MHDTEINIHKLLAERNQIAVIWSIEDVQEVRPDLTADQAWEVLKSVDCQHDANYGVTWNTLADTARYLFGPRPDSAINDDGTE